MKQVYGFSHFTKCGFKIHSSYNLAAMGFTPAEIAATIKKHILEFTVSYQPDFRQIIGDSWPASIDGSKAR